MSVFCACISIIFYVAACLCVSEVHTWKNLNFLEHCMCTIGHWPISSTDHFSSFQYLTTFSGLSKQQLNPPQVQLQISPGVYDSRHPGGGGQCHINTQLFASIFWAFPAYSLTCILLLSSLLARILSEGKRSWGKPANLLRRRVVLVSLTMWPGGTTSSASKSLKTEWPTMTLPSSILRIYRGEATNTEGDKHYIYFYLEHQLDHWRPHWPVHYEIGCVY